MTHNVDTAFDRTFSDPPSVTVAENRTHCEACGATLDASVMHKCAGNAEWKVDTNCDMCNGTNPNCEACGGTGDLLQEAADDDSPILTEQQKYEAMWSHDQYRGVAPGEQIAPEFLSVARPRNGATIIDFGAGTGRGSRAIAILANLHGLDVTIEMLDFATNALDDDVAELCKQDGTTKLRFTQHDLTKAAPVTAPYGFCTDVLEHIPPEQVDTVLRNILQAAQHVFFQISCVDDSCGVLIGHPLHLSVHDGAWWKKKLEDLGCTIHFWRDDEHSCVAYVTAWSDGQDVVDVGVLNIEEEAIRANVRTNVKGGWHQVKPHAPQSTEVMIVGGGPSLAGQLDTIRRMRFEGVKLVTLNGAYNWAIENGLEVSATVVVDARPHNARFTKPVQPQTIYLMGSQVDPSVLEGLPKERTLLWHTTAEAIRDILEEECPGEWFGVPGGSTVLLRAIPLLRMLGFSKFHLFGCDSCVVADAHHAYAQPENDGTPLFPATVGGRLFHCTAWQVAQAQEFMNLIRIMGDMFELEMHGDGLLSWIIQHGAQVDIDLEEAREVSEK